MKKTFLCALLLIAAAVPSMAQKGPLDELGFQPEKLYEFNNIDSVNLFNGNLTLSVPLGIRYSVSSTLSYQFNLVFNGKVYDTETWQCLPSDPCPPTKRPNLRSNAGLGWRVTLGRLLPPYHGTVVSSLDRNLWMYESPAGDEHVFYTTNPDDPVQVNIPAGLRMQKIDPNTRDIELPSGEIHRFQYLSNDWRLTQMRDRYGNAVNISYTFLNNGEALWTITDTVGRQHTIEMENWPAMNDGWSRGWMVKHVHLQAFGSTTARANYDFLYQPRSYFGTGCENDGLDGEPLLASVTLPDQTQYNFSYAPSGGCVSGEVYRMRYPTGGTVTYTYTWAQYPDQVSVCEVPNPMFGVASRTLDDGTGAHTWDYKYALGAYLPVNYVRQVGGVTQPDPDPCQLYPNPPSLPAGPTYWSRTSVIAPLDASGHRNRTDHYFNVLSDGTNGGGYEFVNPFNAGSGGAYGYTGPSGVPPLNARRGPIDTNFLAITDVASSSVGGGLATETFDNCSSAGDCTNGTWLRTTYDTYDSTTFIDSDQGRWNSQALVKSRTAYDDDNSCSPAPCYTQWTKSNNNGLNQYRTTTTEGNFQNQQSATTTMQYATWSSADLLNTSRPWFLNAYTEQTHAEGNVTRRETFCFDTSASNSTGVLLRHRVLLGSTEGPNDILQVFSYGDGHGNLQYVNDYGGDVTAPDTLDTSSSLCSIPLPSNPQYETENIYTTAEGGNSVYTGGIVAASRYHDRATGSALGFFTRDRTIDRWTGAVTAARDTAGVATSFSYDALPLRLHSITSPAGAVTTYMYTAASGTAGSSLTQAKVHASTVATAGTLEKEWAFDGLGRVSVTSASGPSAWSASRTTYDQEGRALCKSEPESTGGGPPTGALTAANNTCSSYDALGRATSVTAPDGSVTSSTYTGSRLVTRTSTVWTGTSRSVPITEEYDSFGRLISVTQESGPTNSSSVVGANIVAAYGYDPSNHLIAVTMGTLAGTGANTTFTGDVQTRLFDYDGRGFLRWESQPESGMVSYTYDVHGHVLTKRQSAAASQFDLNYTYDSAERLLSVYGRNPFYDPSNPSQPQFRSLKEFTYGDSNGTFMRNSQPPPINDLKQGKLVTATRHNYGETTQEPIYDIQDLYHYGDAAGRKTDRTTTITKYWMGSQMGSLPISMSVAYNDLDLPSTISYPMCDGCGAPETDPDRSGVTRTYTAGRLTAMSNFATNISYWPNGMRNVLSHANGIDDTQSVTNMSRPSQIAFGTATHPYDNCVRPSIDPGTPVVTSTSGGSSTLSVTASGGTPPFTYTWTAYNSDGTVSTIATHANLTSTTDSVTVTPTATTSYTVTVANPCGFEYSNYLNIDKNSCPTPSAQVDTVHQPDGSWTLRPYQIVASPSRSWTWVRLSDNVTLLSSATTSNPTLTLGIVSTTTTYRFTVTDSCNSGTRDITVKVPLPITTGLQAVVNTTYTKVKLTWPTINGANVYTVFRRSLGGAWEQAGTSTTASFIDTPAVSSLTYVYRVTSDNGGQTDYDVATMSSLTGAVVGQVITDAPMTSMLAAVNSVRAAAGWPSVTWTSILAANDPVPQPGQLITARQLMACRQRMNEALETLGVTVRPYTDADVFHLSIKADYINEVEQRAQRTPQAF